MSAAGDRQAPALEPLTVSPDGRRLQTASGKPFFYLADTAWTLPQRLKWDDAVAYLNTRAVQGFTAVQLVALDPERDVRMRDAAGEPALLGDDLSRPNEVYFAHLDRILDEAERAGLYVLLLPVWGQLVVGDSWGGGSFPKTVTEANAFEYGRWLGDRYRDRTSIIWCLGGDRHPIHKGTDYRGVWRRLAEGLATGVTGLACRWDEPGGAWDRLLITYHPCFELETRACSTMSYWTEDEAWIRFVALQSGHGLKTRNDLLVKEERVRRRTMPVIDLEPAYERMPMNWPGLFPLHGDWIVRKRAYWAVLAGACGHTYGHASTWCMISERERNEVLDATWFQALSHPGAGQLTVLRRLAEALPFERWVPAQSLLAHDALCGPECLDDHRQAARDRDGEFAIVYLTSGGRECVDLSSLGSDRIEAVWLDPRTGELHEARAAADASPDPGGADFEAPAEGPEQDWILVLATSAGWIERLAEPRVWAEPLETEGMGMVWAE